MAITEELVREELRKVVDPELFVNIVDLGLVYVVELVPVATDGELPSGEVSDAPQAASEPSSETSNEVAADDSASSEVVASDVSPVDIVIDMTMTSPACPAGPQLIANSKQVVGRIPGVRNVEVRIVMDPPWTPDRMTDEARDQLGIF